MKYPHYITPPLLCALLAQSIYAACNMAMLLMFTLHTSTFATDPVSFQGYMLIALAVVSTGAGLCFNQLHSYRPRDLLATFFTLTAAVNFSYCMVFWSGYDGETVSDLAFVLQAVVIGASKLLAAFTGLYFKRHINIEVAKVFNVRIATINSVAVILSSIMIAGTILIAGWFYSAFPILDSCVMISLLGSLPVLISGGVIWYTFDTLDAVSSATKITRSMDLRELKGQFSTFMSQPATEVLLAGGVVHLAQDGITAFVQLFLLENGIDEIGISRIVSTCAALDIVGKVIYPLLRFKYPQAPFIWILFAHSILGLLTTGYWLSFEIFITPDLPKIYLFIGVFFVFEVSLSFYNMVVLETLQKTVAKKDRLAVMGVEHTLSTVLSVIKLVSITYSPAEMQYVAMFGLSFLARCMFLVLVVMFLRKKGSRDVLNQQYEVLDGASCGYTTNEEDGGVMTDAESNYGDTSGSPVKHLEEPFIPSKPLYGEEEGYFNEVKPVKETTGLLRRPYGSLDDN